MVYYCSLCGSIAEDKDGIGLMCCNPACEKIGGGFLEVDVGDVVELLKGGSIIIQPIRNPEWRRYIKDKEILRVVGWSFERISTVKRRLIAKIHEADEDSPLTEYKYHLLVDEVFGSRP